MRDKIYDRRSDFENCWYRAVCEDCDTQRCSANCRKFTQTDYLLQLSNLPRSCWQPQRLSMQYLSPETTEILKTILVDCEFFIKKGFNLYLYGETGCGKTSWAIKIMLNYFAAIAESNDFSVRGLYINVSSFLRDSRLYMTYTSEDYLELLNTIKTCDVVIWDDIAQTTPTNYESQWLYSFINERVIAKKSNIFTSNLSPEQLSELDKRMYSRVCEGSDCLPITGIDMRSYNTYTKYMGGADYGSDSDNK